MGSFDLRRSVVPPVFHTGSDVLFLEQRPVVNNPHLRCKGKVGLIGGGREIGEYDPWEDPLTALARELSEETNASRMAISRVSKIGEDPYLWHVPEQEGGSGHTDKVDLFVAWTPVSLRGKLGHQVLQLPLGSGTLEEALSKVNRVPENLTTFTQVGLSRLWPHRREPEKAFADIEASLRDHRMAHLALAQTVRI